MALGNATVGHSSGSTHSQIVVNEPWLSGLRVVWVLVFALNIIIPLASIPTLQTTYQEKIVYYATAAVEGADSLRATIEAMGWTTADVINVQIVLGISTSAVLMTGGMYIFWHRSGYLTSLIWALALVMYAPTFTYQGFSLVANVTATIPYPWQTVASLFQYMSFPTVMVAFLIFPDGYFVPRWTAWLLILWYAPAIISIIDNTPYDFTVMSLRSIISWLAFLTQLIVPIVAQFYRYFRVSTPAQRQQTKWVVLIVMFMVLPLLYIVLLQALIPESNTWPIVFFYNQYGFVTITLLPIALIAAMWRYRLWDIDVVINKSLVYAIMVALAIALFFGIILGLQIAVGNTEPLIALTISVIVSVAIFAPVRNNVQFLVDRYIYRLRFDLIKLERAQQPITITNPGKLTGLKFGDYEVRGLIGKGGMGEVYEGFGNGQRVAIKTMLSNISRDPELRTRFEREVEAGMALRHPNITQVIASGEYDDMPYLVMDFIDGQDLGEMLKSQGSFDEETALQIMKDICAALTVVHQAGYVHRDLKPGNIMIRENGSVSIMDFGVSKVKHAHTITGTGALGTIQYMAPEQIRAAKDVDHRADIYALGVVLYQMLTGVTPFTGNPAQVLFAHLQQPAPDPREINNTISESVGEALLKALEKDPDKRFADVGAFMNGLLDRPTVPNPSL